MGTVKFLVTGCAGFIGGHMLEKLVAGGYATVGVDNFSTGKRENMAAVQGKFEFIEGDVSDPAVAARAVKGVTHIIHLASIPSVPRSVDNPLENMQSSVSSTVALMDAARKESVQRIVQASSSAIYGDSPTLPKTEDMLPNALSPYAAAKLAQEYYGMAFSTSHGLDTASLRYFNVFGPRQDPKSEYAAVIPKFVTLMLSGKAPTVFGDGKQTRDFIYVENVVAGNLAAALHPGKLKGEAMNLACGTSIDLNQLVAKINAVLKTDFKPQYAPSRSGEVLHSVADIGKVKRLIGYSPAIDFDAGLERTIKHFR